MPDRCGAAAIGRRVGKQRHAAHARLRLGRHEDELASDAMQASTMRMRAMSRSTFAHRSPSTSPRRAPVVALRRIGTSRCDPLAFSMMARNSAPVGVRRPAVCFAGASVARIGLIVTTCIRRACWKQADIVVRACATSSTRTRDHDSKWRVAQEHCTTQTRPQRVGGSRRLRQLRT